MLNANQRQMLTAAAGGLFGYALALTRNRDSAADLVQDCVVRAISAKQAPQDERAFRAWLFTIARHLWLVLSQVSLLSSKMALISSF